MKEQDRLKSLAAQCRALAVQAPTLAAKDEFNEMALDYECRAEAATLNKPVK